MKTITRMEFDFIMWFIRVISIFSVLFTIQMFFYSYIILSDLENISLYSISLSLCYELLKAEVKFPRNMSYVKREIKHFFRFIMWLSKFLIETLIIWLLFYTIRLRFQYINFLLINMTFNIIYKNNNVNMF